jgi:undecaprenyl diphosphate synthase
MRLKEKIKPERVPQHIAIIMDGNGRWAKLLGKMRFFGHQGGVRSVKEVSEGCAELGIKYLTLYAFSTENWNRPRTEVSDLMGLLARTIRNESKTLMKNNIRLDVIGDRSMLPADCNRELDEAIELTRSNSRMTLILALSYSSRWDLVHATREIALQIEKGKLTVDDINEELISNTLTTHKYPHPDLMIRTSGEMRISNFLLWELAYSELYFTDVLWPDFKKEDLYCAILDYQGRERRFGKISEQISQP